MTTGGRAGRRLHRTPPGHHLHSGVDVIHDQEREKRSRPGTTSHRRANARTSRNRSRRAQCGRSTTNVADHRGAFLTTTDPLVGLRPRTGGGTPRAIARIEVRAIGSAMWLERCCCRQRPHRIPAPALVVARSSNRGSSCRRARYPSDHRTWRAAEERSVRNHRLQPPTLKVGPGCTSVNTKCVRDCVRRFWSTARARQGTDIEPLPVEGPATAALYAVLDAERSPDWWRGDAWSDARIPHVEFDRVSR